MDNSGPVALQRCSWCFTYHPWTELVNNRCSECQPVEPPQMKRYSVRGALRTR